MKQKNTFKYDKYGRLYAFYWSAGRMAYQYQYMSSKGPEMRRETIQCPNNRSNYKVITIQIKKDGTWTPERRLELGEKYNTYLRFFNDEVIFTRRFNKKIKTTMEKSIFKSSNGQLFWVMNYNNKKSIGFKIDPKKLK